MVSGIGHRGELINRRALALATVIVAVSIALIAAFDKTTFVLWYDDIGEAVVAAGAGFCAFRRALRVDRRHRWSWVILTGGCTAWAAGEVIWCWNELRYGEAPFPSIADIGFLAFSAAACAALALYPTDDGGSSRKNRILDTISTTGSIALIAWVTVLSAITRNHAQGDFSYAISLTYPLADVVVLVLSVLILGRVRRDRMSLFLMAGGFVALSVSDSAFVYLQADSNYTGGIPDLGWFVGFTLLALGGLANDKDDDKDADSGSEQASTLTFVPYIPLLLALVVTVAAAISGHGPNRGQLALAAGLVLMLLGRQYLTLRANIALATNLADREAELHHQAFHDNLTGLANRALFQDRLAHALDLHARDLRPVAVIFLDLDDFKIVNDTLGHSVGDELLTHVAERITGATRNGDTVARLGGDEFAVLVESSGDPTIAAGRITDALRGPFLIADQRITVAASIGVVSLDPSDEATSADLLVTQADTAMYAAKRGGKGRIELYHDGMSLLELSDKQLSIALTHAIRTNELTVAFQPILELATGAVSSIETLARWSHNGVDIPPDVFIPVAERTGVIGELTTYVIRRACEQAVASSQIPGYETLSVAVNIPPQEIGTPELEATIRTMIERYRILPTQLCIEITETGLFANAQAAKSTIASLRALGVRVALDDFGVGYSSLAQLHDIELDSVKIDRSFVERLETDVRQVKFLRTIIRLGQDVDLKVIAEGVERTDQLQVLKRLGCPYAQGYLFARPMSGADMLAYLAATPATHAQPSLSHF
jgi:diguanylate cyclase (GGDEF)-like protein